MRWIDTEDIAIELEELHPEINLMSLRFTELRKLVLNLKEFDDDETRCNEKVLEAIQAAWIEERG